MKPTQQLNKPACHSKGQGVVEYAGALAVAAVLVGSVVASGGGDFSTLFQAALNNAMETIQGLLP